MADNKGIILTGTQENLETIFDELIEIGLKDNKPPTIITHVHIWSSLKEVSAYCHKIDEHDRKHYKILNANLPSHRKHVKKIAKELVNND